MMRRSHQALYKIVIVESPNKVRSINSYMSRIDDLSFGRSELSKICSPGEHVDVFPTIGHFQEMARVLVTAAASGHATCGDDKSNNNNINNKDDCPASFKFRCEWKTTDAKKDPVARIRSALQQNMSQLTEVILASDPDREGELISVHALHSIIQPTLLASSSSSSSSSSSNNNKQQVAYSRAYIHSITPEGVADAMKARKLNFVDEPLANAANARHLLDRVFGFYGSRLVNSIQRQIRSVGRVQSPALILVHDRCKAHDDVLANRVTTYSLGGRVQLPPTATSASTTAGDGDADNNRVVHCSVRIHTGSTETPQLYPQSLETAEKVISLVKRDVDTAAVIDSSSSSNPWQCNIKRTTTSTNPPQPLTLQALILACGRRYKMSSAEVGQACQRLFTDGHITYPRTDSTRINEDEVKIIQGVVRKEFGDAAVETTTKLEKRNKKKKDENVEDAHEAIHPTKAHVTTPGTLGGRELQVYQIIRNTTLASVMVPLKTESCTVTATPPLSKASTRKLLEEIAKTSSGGGGGGGGDGDAAAAAVVFDPDRASIDITFTARHVLDNGWRRAMMTGGAGGASGGGGDADGGTDNSKDGVAAEDPFFSQVAALGKSSQLKLVDIVPVEKKTAPPPLYFEGSLIEELKRNGIGRPSTYSSIMETLHKREYIKADSNKKLRVTETGEKAVALAKRLFPEFVAMDFTSAMEGDLDGVVSGTSMDIPVSNCLATLLRDTRKACIDSFADAAELTDAEKEKMKTTMEHMPVHAGRERDFDDIMGDLRRFLMKNYRGLPPQWQPSSSSSSPSSSSTFKKKPSYNSGSSSSSNTAKESSSSSTTATARTASTKKTPTSRSSSNKSAGGAKKSTTKSSAAAKPAPRVGGESAAGAATPKFRSKK